MQEQKSQFGIFLRSLNWSHCGTEDVLWLLCILCNSQILNLPETIWE